jgi:hypothetical protein
MPWQIYDSVTTISYSFDIDPDSFTIKSQQKAINTTATSAGQRQLSEGRSVPPVLSWSGTIMTESDLNKWREIASIRHQVRLTDDLGKIYWIYITSFRPNRQLKRYVPWFHTYSVEATILDW